MAKKKIVITDNGVKAIFDYIDQKIDDSTSTLKNEISHLPTKDEFYEQTLKVLKKLDDLEVAMTISNNRIAIHSDEIERLKDIHRSGHHPS